MIAPAPEVDEQRAFYDGYLADRQYVNNLKLERCIRILEAVLSLRLNRPAILDLGCGSGWLSNVLGHVGPTTGVDLSGAAVETASENYPHARFLQADLTRWSGGAEQYDLVVSQEVIEHMEDQAAYLRLAHRMLGDGGFLILTTPNARTFNAMPDDQRSAWAGQPIENWLSPAQLRALLAQDFEVIRVTTIIPKYGIKGVYRFWSSPRIHRVARILGLGGLFTSLRLKLGYGLHTLAVAQKKPGAGSAA